MESERDAGERFGTGDRPGLGTAGERIEKIVPPLAVIAISIAGMLASVMQPRAERPEGARALATAVQPRPLHADDRHAAAASRDCRATGSPRMLVQRRGQG